MPEALIDASKQERARRPVFAAAFTPLPGRTMDTRRFAIVLKAMLDRHAGRHGFKCIDIAMADPDDPRPARTALTAPTDEGDTQ